MIPPDMFPEFIQSIKTLTDVRNVKFRAELSDIFRQAQIHNISVEALAEQFLTASSVEYLTRAELVAEEMLVVIEQHQAALAEHEVVQTKQLVENWLTFTLDQVRNELFNHQAFAQFPFGITDQRISNYFGSGLTSSRGTAFGAAGAIIRKKIKASPVAAQLQTMAEVLEEFLYEAIVREDEQKVRALAVSHIKSAVPPKPQRPKKAKPPTI